MLQLIRNLSPGRWESSMSWPIRLRPWEIERLEELVMGGRKRNLRGSGPCALVHFGQDVITEKTLNDSNTK